MDKYQKKLDKSREMLLSLEIDIVRMGAKQWQS